MINFYSSLSQFLVESFSFLNSSLCTIEKNLYDAPENWQCLFQDPATPTMEGIINFHHDVNYILIVICVMVMWLLGRCVFFFEESKNPIPAKFIHGTFLEIVWTTTPAIILVFVAVPSFALLYSMDEIIDPAMTLKIMGHQWYWSYQYSDYITDNDQSLDFESYMIPELDLKKGQLRLLEVDNRVVVPSKTHIRILVTAADVLHSWAIPSLALKLDGCPGRLNQANMFIKREGVYYGQCSEICGINHGFMPIVVESVSLDKYKIWLIQQIKDLA